ncbi:LytR/AlgR family response regulator transcription factor [Dyadobacter chenhuakuii]|uniref:LytTR family DNA-binding domain-containing protein n=1 Tax=Dyadobacter chenhuakuii TaxID=2909339 RepID=A0A9X1QC73_9BACT|nr:LytTR family DNA-binding domain-containing protein [Dyadobacter chenhuakuii]MCF2493089.1 LytTR family DNA-binding domain-containing protein [Dyadobacter chenhuakuii]MCF2499153.1 LytTR family DNA-binding domain-containing protein [Dyadobacter chenhuakuii]USJ32624.1 LytTR family DNA-binding domain-containing protein [Dyadobacter chenhuakuii]
MNGQVIRAIAIDDEPMALRVIESHAHKMKQLDLIMTTTDAVEGLVFAQNHDIDLIFLDIQMPDLTGIQFLKQLAGQSKVVLTTAYTQYALEGYDYDVIDYLLKPISFDRFLRSVQKMQRLFITNEAAGASNIALENPTKTDFGVIFIKTEHKLVKVDHQDLLYLQGGKDYTTVVTRSEKLLTLTTLAKFEESLPEAYFMRVHKSYLVALTKIQFIERQRIFIDHAVIPIGDSYKEHVFKKIGG